MAFNEETRLFRGKFSPPTVCASFPMFCIENSGERIKAISRSLVEKGTRTRVRFRFGCEGNGGVVNKRYSRARYPILRLLSFGIC